MSTTQTLLNDVQQGVPSGNYDGSSLDFASDAAAGPGYYQGNAGTQTVAVRVANFDGRIQLQGTLDCLPGDGTNWVSLAEFDTSDSAATYTEIVTVTGQFVWIRARVINFLDGTINSVTSTYAGAGADIGGGSDVTAGVFSSVTANAVYVGTTGVVSSGNITAPYFLGNGRQLTGITGLDSFSVSTLPPAGDGALVYNSANGVFQFTPADAGASDYGNANVVAYAESGWAGNIVPATDDQYSLGNATNQWSELWVSNSTIYIGGVPVGITGNVLTVNGEPVLSNDSDSDITTSGNITANYFIGDGSQLTGLPEQYGNANVATFLADFGSNAITTTGDITGNFILADLQVIATGDVTGSNIVGINSIQTSGYIVATGNISGGNILTDNYLYANGAPFVSASTGNITFTDTTLSPPDGVDIFITAANSEVEITGLDFRVDVTDDVRIIGNDIVSLRNRSSTEDITITTDLDGNAETWTFAADGTLSTPGDIVVNGTVSGTEGTNTLYVAAQPSSNTYIQLNNVVDSTIQTHANLEIRTDVSNTAQVWSFDTNGDLTVPNYILFKGNTYIGDEPGSGSPAFRIVAPLTYGATIETDSDISGNSWTWTFGADGVLGAPGNITATNFIGDIAAANVTGLATVATTGSYDDLSDQPTIPTLGNFTLTDNTIQTGNGVGGITLSIFGPDAADPPAFISRDWTFANTGAFTSTGNVSAPNFLGNIAASNVVGTVSAATTAGTVTGNAQANITSVGTLSSLSVSGNITGGNIDTDGQITVDALSITNSSIAAVTQFTISTSNTATGNSSSILMDRNGVGVVVQLEDTGGGPYSWGLYQDNLLFPDGSRQYSAYGNVNVVANLAALGSNPISTTGNVSAGNFIGAGSNVELVAGSYTWTFDNSGNTSFANGTVTVSNLVANGTASLGNTATVTTGNYQIGYRDIPQVAFTGNTTLSATDAGKHFHSTESTDYILTIADNSAVSWPVGTAITVVNRGTGNITVAQASGVSLYLAGNSSAGNRNVTTYGMATLLNVAANVWMINGTGVS